jgi:hypothetical protein
MLALGLLFVNLEKNCGLTINRSKCAAVGTTPGACALKPPRLPEPTSFKNDDGAPVETGARGIIICQNPIGEHDFAKTFLGQKINSIRSAIEKSYSMQKACALRQDAHNGIVRCEPEIFPG